VRADDTERARDPRRAARAEWPIARFSLGQEPLDDLSAATTAADRVAMMWRLAVDAWRLAGRRLPTYDRRSIPARLYRPGEPRPDDDDA
jgi:hypothetical protein